MKRQWQGRVHPVVGRGLELWHGIAMPGAGFGTVLCDTILDAVEHFTAQPWADGASRITLQVDNQRFTLINEANGWVLPASRLEAN